MEAAELKKKMPLVRENGNFQVCYVQKRITISFMVNIGLCHRQRESWVSTWRLFWSIYDLNGPLTACHNLRPNEPVKWEYTIKPEHHISLVIRIGWWTQNWVNICRVFWSIYCLDWASSNFDKLGPTKPVKEEGSRDLKTWTPENLSLTISGEWEWSVIVFNPIWNLNTEVSVFELNFAPNNGR